MISKMPESKRIQNRMLDFISVALKNVFSKPSTRKYPYVKRTPFSKQRGHIDININDCIFCGMCSRKCPVGAIKVIRAEKSWEIDRFKCVNCSYCAESCPKKCLSVEPEYVSPAFKKNADKFIQKTKEETDA